MDPSVYVILHTMDIPYVYIRRDEMTVEVFFCRSVEMTVVTRGRGEREREENVHVWSVLE
jgi:hypothetical protein